MNGKKAWYNDDQFWIDCYPILFPEQKILDAKTQLDDLIKLLNIPVKLNVLDLCCGVGRHTLEMARRGYNVTGIDRTEYYLDIIKEAAERENLDTNLIKADMRDDLGEDKYDLVLNFNTSLGYFESEDDDARVMANVYRSLKKDGVLIIDMMGKEINSRMFKERDWRREGDYLFLEERRIVGYWQRMAMTWTVIKDNIAKKLELNFRLFSAVELAGLLKSSGFDDINIYGDYKGAPYDDKASRLVAVAKK